MTEDAAGGSATGSEHSGSAGSVLPVLALRQSENEILAMQMECLKGNGKSLNYF